MLLEHSQDQRANITFSKLLTLQNLALNSAHLQNPFPCLKKNSLPSQNHQHTQIFHPNSANFRALTSVTSQTATHQRIKLKKAS